MGLQARVGANRGLTHAPRLEPIDCKALRQRLAMQARNALQATPPSKPPWEKSFAYNDPEEAKTEPSQSQKMTFEAQETVVPHWTGTARKKPRARSAIANGRKLIMADGRSMWAKRFIEICAGHCQDLGGFENLSQAEIALIKRASTLEVELESLETRLARGEGKVDLVEFAQISNGLRRLLETVGIKRVPRDVTPTLAEILAGDDRSAR